MNILLLSNPMACVKKGPVCDHAAKAENSYPNIPKGTGSRAFAAPARNAPPLTSHAA